MGGYDRSLRRGLRHHSCQDPRFGVSSDLPHTSGEAMNDPSIYPRRSPWAKVKISPSLMKSSAVWPQIRAEVWGWCGGQGCAYISPNLGAWEYISPNLSAWQYILPNPSASAYISPYRSVWETECVQWGYQSTCETCPTCHICASNVVWMRRCCPTCPFFNMVHVRFHWEYHYIQT